MTRPNKPLAARSGAVSAAAGMSWMALVAATTFGAGEFDFVRAEISGDDPVGDDGTPLRLIVQAYDSGAVGDGNVPSPDARPHASLQRAITAEELKKGVSVELVNVRGGAAKSDAVVVAWIERGLPDLEFDALRARPMPGAFVGTGTREAPTATEPVRLRLA